MTNKYEFSWILGTVIIDTLFDLFDEVGDGVIFSIACLSNIELVDAFDSIADFC